MKHVLQKILELHEYDCEAYNGPGKCLQLTLSGEKTLGTMMSAVVIQIVRQPYDENTERVSMHIGDAFESMKTHAFGSDTVVLFPTVTYVKGES